MLLWLWASILYDYHLDLVLRDSLYHLYGDASVNLIEQAVNVIGSERSRVEINLKYISSLRLGRTGEEMINKLETYGFLGSLTFESYLVYASSL